MTLHRPTQILQSGHLIVGIMAARPTVLASRLRDTATGFCIFFDMVD